MMETYERQATPTRAPSSPTGAPPNRGPSAPKRSLPPPPNAMRTVSDPRLKGSSPPGVVKALPVPPNQKMTSPSTAPPRPSKPSPVTPEGNSHPDMRRNTSADSVSSPPMTNSSAKSLTYRETNSEGNPGSSPPQRPNRPNRPLPIRVPDALPMLTTSRSVPTMSRVTDSPPSSPTDPPRLHQTSSSTWTMRSPSPNSFQGGSVTIRPRRALPAPLFDPNPTSSSSSSSDVSRSSIDSASSTHSDRGSKDKSSKKEKKAKKSKKEKKQEKERTKKLEEKAKSEAMLSDKRWNGMRAKGIEDHEMGTISFKKGEIIHVLDCGAVIEASLLPKIGGGGGMYTAYLNGNVGFVASHCIEFIQDATPDANLRQMKSKLMQLLTKPDLTVVAALCEVLDRSQVEYVSKALVNIFKVEGNIIDVIKYTTQKEVRETTDPATLFRNNSMASFLMGAYSKTLGHDWFKSCLKPIIVQVCQSGKPMEIDVGKMGPNEKLENNIENLRFFTQQFIDAIVSTGDQCPAGIRHICKILADEVSQKFPKHFHEAIGGFVFLRYLTPPIVSPDSIQLVDADLLTPENRRKLMLISKSIQNLGNGVKEFKKEPFMSPMTSFLEENMEKVKTSFHVLADVWDDMPRHNVGTWESVDETSVTTIHQQISFKLAKICEAITRIQSENKQRLNYDPLQTLISLCWQLGFPIKK
eukprot:TRINITY_DN4673_c0_g1_i1.p1 TRINITY_DN4673_c0_g1~~TRINITY_DN4673_c0_g1_i1.p1  ORF type:complete len:694 (-),score=213.51 TRINITY_DN4673_c0_g1_i1:29-2110(-)